jgi:hypothetical protein
MYLASHSLQYVCAVSWCFFLSSETEKLDALCPKIEVRAMIALRVFPVTMTGGR